LGDIVIFVFLDPHDLCLYFAGLGLAIDDARRGAVGAVLADAGRRGVGNLSQHSMSGLAELNSPGSAQSLWLALSIGNSRHHWGAFQGQQLQATWDIANVQMPAELAMESGQLAQQLQALPGWPSTVQLGMHLPPLWLMAVVPSYRQRWLGYPQLHQLGLENIPLGNLYPSLGVDRALAVWGAGVTYGFPVLVIDGGTALTFSGANAAAQFCGGAILPGLGLQFRALAQDTAALPQVSPISPELPPRWGMDTPNAISSGILYTMLAGVRDFIEDWQQQYPESAILFTGGDGEYLLEALNRYNATADSLSSTRMAKLSFDPNVGFVGMATLAQSLT
jgi:type III pantothenate kinase